MLVTSEEKAICFYHELVVICAKGGFQLTKSISNRCDVLAVIPKGNRA